MGLLGKLAVVASAAVAVAAMGVVYAGTASASSTAQTLCIINHYYHLAECAQAPSANGESIFVQVGASSSSKWYYPIGGGERTIRHNGTDGCMQVQSDGHVILETCTTNPNQEWSLYWFGNGWDMFQDAYNKQCLEYAAAADTLITDKCSTTTTGQMFYPGLVS